MDDGTFSTSNVSRLKARRDAWASWGGKVGLCEHLGNRQVTARSVKQKGSLHNFFCAAQKTIDLKLGSQVVSSYARIFGLLVNALMAGWPGCRPELNAPGT